MAVVAMKQLLEAGVTWTPNKALEPKNARLYFTERNGIYIIDLQKTVRFMDVT